MTELILTENDKFWEGEGLTEDSDEFFEKYKLAIPKDGYGGFSNAEGEDISWCLRTNWEKMARPVGSDDWNDFILSTQSVVCIQLYPSKKETRIATVTPM